MRAETTEVTTVSRCRSTGEASDRFVSHKQIGWGSQPEINRARFDPLRLGLVGELAHSCKVRFSGRADHSEEAGTSQCFEHLSWQWTEQKQQSST